MRIARGRGVGGVLVACASLLIFAAVSAGSTAAAAGIGIERYSLTATEEGGSEDTQAGSHPYELTADVGLSQPSSSLEDLDLELPAGVVLNGWAVPRCESYGGGCGDGTAVGVAMVTAEGKVYPAAVYNLAPEPGKLAQLGFVVGGTHFMAAVALRPGDEGMTLSMDHIGATMAIAGIRLTLWGVPGEAGHNALRGGCATGEATDCSGGGWGSFVTLPTACGEALDTHTTALADTWQDPDEWASEPASFPAMTGCDRLAFEPTIGVMPEVSGVGESSAYEIQLGVPQNEGPRGLATSELQSAQVTLPAGVSLSLAYINGMEGCSEAQIAFEYSDPRSCPNASVLGRAEINTPLQSRPLVGDVYLAAENANPLYAPLAVYLDVDEVTAGVTVKLVGQIVANPATGQLTIVFDDVPQLPIGSIALKLHGLLDNPQACGQATSTGQMVSWSGDAPAVVQSSTPFTDTGCQNPPAAAVSKATGATRSTQPAISHIKGRLSGDRLLLRFTTSASGSLTITGPGIHTYTQRKMRPGVHNVKITLSRRGVIDVRRRYHRFELEFRLKAVGGAAGAETAVVDV
ncbi:MAG TPA: hypothetical protein VK790_11375 [Solirubrobacteraceae bacterium]|nr:hypothetical protein [Solirubrobacteraceae bacterium]